MKVAIIGGGCGSVAAAFELSRPRHQNKYHVTLYQMGWRLGGKGASGRGPSDRIEEHGLHIWLGFYDNAFGLLRECYKELDRDKRRWRFADWRDAFMPDSHVGVANCSAQGDWGSWTAHIPSSAGLPGDPIDPNVHFTIGNYLSHAMTLLRVLLFGVETHALYQCDDDGIYYTINSLARVGVLSGAAGLIEAISLVETALQHVPKFTSANVVRLVEMIVGGVRERLEHFVEDDPEARFKWEIIDIVVATLVGFARFGLFTDPRGFDAIDDYDCREWLRINGASERALNSGYLLALHDFVFAFEDGNPVRPRISAGLAMRAIMRFFFSYRGALFWKMRAGMGDVVFTPFYEALVDRGVDFQFFHRLTNVKLANPSEGSYIAALEFDIQAKIRDGKPYDPLVEINSVKCWPSKPNYVQLEDAERLEKDGVDFECHWHREASSTKTLHVTHDFDLVILGVSIGEIPYVCKEILARDARWRAMVANIKTVATQAFQIWLKKDLQQLGWKAQPVTFSGYERPFETWADMAQVVPAEVWRDPPGTVIYFCGLLPDINVGRDFEDPDYPGLRHDEVGQSAIRYLNKQIGTFWPKATNLAGFRWEILTDYREDGSLDSATALRGEARFASQFWKANINPTDRYVLSLPGTSKFRISPLDMTYDNLTVAGDWTNCGFNLGCVEAAVMSGRLAAHAISGYPALEDIVAYDHP